MREPAARALRPDDLFDLRFVHDARLSPDGQRVAYVISRTDATADEEFFELALQDLDSPGGQRLLDFPGKATHPRWSPDGRHLAFVGVRGSERRLHLMDVNTGGSSTLTSGEGSVVSPPSWSADGSQVACAVETRRQAGAVRRVTKRIFRSAAGYVDDASRAIHVVDVRSGANRVLKTRGLAAMQPQFAADGKRLLFLAANPESRFSGLGSRLFTIDLAGERISEVLDGQWAVAAAAWVPGGDRIVFAGARSSELTIPKVALWVVGGDGAGAESRTSDLHGNVGARVHHDMPTWETSQGNFFAVADANHAYATVAAGGCTEIWRVALAGPARCERVVFGPRSCIALDACARTSRLVYASSDVHRPWELAVMDLESGRERQLTSLNDAVLARWPAMQVEHLPFQSADGLPLEAWHMARADRKGRQPTVLFIHGGPFLATGHAFRFDFHLLAANGYGAVFANFRGSAGYGEAFAQAIMGNWGGRGMPDHLATVDAAVAKGLADPERLGIWGASHGGFATAWMIGHSARFRAAVVESGVSNFATLYYLTDAPDLFAHDLGGRPDQIPDVYRACSPLTYASRCRTPTLILHGEADVRCSMAEPEQLYRALHDAGCVTELVIIAGMTHMGDSTGPLSARRGQNEALLEWFERYL